MIFKESKFEGEACFSETSLSTYKRDYLVPKSRRTKPEIRKHLAANRLGLVLTSRIECASVTISQVSDTIVRMFNEAQRNKETWKEWDCSFMQA